MASRGIEFKKVEGVYGWYDKVSGKKLNPDELTKHDLNEGSAYVHQDTMKTALRHPVTCEKIDSLTKWNRENKRLGLECVGNDLLSKRKPQLKDKITDEKIMNAIEKAESILSDPAKTRAYRNEQIERAELHARTVGRTALQLMDS